MRKHSPLRPSPIGAWVGLDKNINKFTERENDDYDGWNEMASQADFDSF